MLCETLSQVKGNVDGEGLGKDTGISFVFSCIDVFLYIYVLLYICVLLYIFNILHSRIYTVIS